MSDVLVREIFDRISERSYAILRYLAFKNIIALVVYRSTYKDTKKKSFVNLDTAERYFGIHNNWYFFTSSNNLYRYLYRLLTEQLTFDSHFVQKYCL